jgi:acetyltransferase
VRSARSLPLDALRGIAALAVVLFHVWAYARPVPGSTLETASDKVLNEGRLGLILFFVLSGFLLYMPWARATLDDRPGPALGPYALRRAARIVPAYYLAIAGAVVLLWGAADTPGVALPPAAGLPLFFVFGQNFSSARC